MNVAIVASHDIELTREIASKVASFIVVLKDENERELATWGDTNKISVRANTNRVASPVEEMAVRLAGELGLDTYWVRPYRNDRAAVYERDFSLVQSAHRVMAFFHRDRIMEGGTGHVVNAALMRGVPVEAWAHDESGTLVSIGTDEGFEVGSEGSRWMQLHYLTWQAQKTEQLLQTMLVHTSSTPVATYIGTVTSASANPDGTYTGKISLPATLTFSPQSPK